MDVSAIDQFTIDPPPHNRRYFQDQIIAAHNYFLQASSGQFILSGEVFPIEQDSAYTMDQTMGYYSPNRTDEENNARLAQLFVDAVTKADQDTSFHFSDFNPLVVIFHAGVGKDIDLGYDTTPQDIPSLYLSPDFFKKVFGNTFKGVPVDNGTLHLDRGIILPETESQEDIEAALTGIFAANIGTHLGLYDLFSPKEQMTGIGRLGLMDAGLFNLYGLAPALPSAFSREIAGWEKPVKLQNPKKNISISRMADPMSNGTTCYKIALNSDEYFLLEYRGEYHMSVAIDSIYQELYNLRDEPPTYLETLYKLQETYPGIMEVSDSTGVVLKLDNYDWGLPGSGILIWHIDSLRIRQSADLNAINDDPERRAVDLEEADGSQDIGQIYSITDPGFQSELGTWLDFWFKSNPAPLYKNEFSKNTAPNTLSNRNYGNPQIKLSAFSDNRAATMTFDFENERFLAGFPITVGSTGTSGGIVLAAVENIEAPVIFTCDIENNIYAVTGEGKGIFNPDEIFLHKFQGNSIPQLTLADRNNNGLADLLLAADQSGRIEFFNLAEARIDTILWRDEGIILPLIVKNPFLYIGNQDGNIERISFSGASDSTYSFNHQLTGFTVVAPGEIYISENALFGPFVLDLNGNGQKDLVTMENERMLSISVDNRNDLVNLPVSCMAAPSFADINSDGFYEIILTLSDRIYVLNYNGSPVSGFPFIPRKTVECNLVGTALCFSNVKTNQSLIIVSDAYGNAFACDNNGEMIEDFSFTIGSTIMNSGVLTDINRDGYLEYLISNNQGILQGWQLDKPISDCKLWWAQASFDFTRNNYIETVLPIPPTDEKELLPKHRVYNYPNPNKENYTILRYYLREVAAVSITIFDLAGDMVDQFSTTGTGKIENEFRWNLDKIASGIYLARIEARSVKATEAHIIKIMVVH